MIALKKTYCDELLQLALVLSLLRVDPDSYMGYMPSVGLDIRDLNYGTSWARAPIASTLIQRPYIHPKSLDSILQTYQQELFEDLNALGRYNRLNTQQSNFTAYLLNVDTPSGVINSSIDTHEAEQDTNTSNRTVEQDTNSNNRTVESPVENVVLSGSDSVSDLLDDVLFHPIPDDVLFPPIPDEVQGAELTQEDMDLIEVLWKQDVDLGFSLDLFNTPKTTEQDEKKAVAEEPAVDEDDVEKLKALESLKTNSSEIQNVTADDDLDPWAGLPYTIDLETGEYVLKSNIDELNEDKPSGNTGSDNTSGLVDDLPALFSLEEALQLVGLDEDPGVAVGGQNKSDEDLTGACSPKKEECDVKIEVSSDDELEGIDTMIQTSQFHHPRALQGRMPFVRAMSMEQRWQDLANLLSLPGSPDTQGMAHPFSHHHHHHHHHNYSTGHGMSYTPDPSTRGVLLHNATLAPPMGDLNASSPYPTMGPSNLGSAVATSMNLTNSSEPLGDGATTPAFKMENHHDLMYYQNSSSEINQTTDGFLSSILNDEDLQLMDMAMSEGMYTMRMLDSNSSNNGSTNIHHSEERMDASSDSAVSSMGSERVPSLSDGEWMETGSDSGHTAGDHFAVDYGQKYRPYDYSYSSRHHASPAVPDTSHRNPPMAQKKHQMFGKRYFQEQGTGNAPLGTSPVGNHIPAPSFPVTPVKYEYGENASVAPTTSYGEPVEGAVGPKPAELKYSCSMEFMRHHPEPRTPLEHVQHNHSYHMPPESVGAMQRPITRDKQRGRKSEGEHLNRDEKRARSMNIPITVSDIINLPMDEFNERLSKYDLSETQLSLIRDIRRRGKNKVAAQNCRKRKLDQILCLADEVKEMRDRKNRLLRERDMVMTERQRVKEKFSQLYRHVFQSLRDADGNQYSSYEYSLQQSADGTVLLVPRTNSSAPMDSDMSRPKPKHPDHYPHQQKE